MMKQYKERGNEEGPNPKEGRSLSYFILFQFEIPIWHLRNFIHDSDVLNRIYRM